MFLHLSVILGRGGVHPLGRHPPDRQPLGRHSTMQTHPLGSHPQADAPYADTPGQTHEIYATQFNFSKIQIHQN